METTLAGKFNFRLATIVSLVVMLVIMLWVSKDFGITGDEVTQNTYGEKVFDYYRTFGKDESALSFRNVYYYGGFYDLLCVTVNKVSPFDPFNTRHFINAIFGFLIIVVASRWARYYKGWGAALLAAWFLFLTPRFFGESMNNPKDVPFALGMVLGAYYICRFVDMFPKPSKRITISLILSIAFAISIRVGGILLIPFLFVAIGLKYFFEWRKPGIVPKGAMQKFALRVLVVCILGYIGGLIFWPYGLQNPLSNPLKALGEMSQFSTGIRMLFADEQIMSSNVPWYYIPKWLWITTPVIILAGIIMSPILFLIKQYKFQNIFFLFFVALFPLLYVIYKKSPLYDGWRHLFFIYPALAIIASLTFISLQDAIKNRYAKYAITAILVIGLILPARWCIANNPNEIVYFNEIQGGVDGAYGYYETDYYMNSVKQASYKLANIAGLYNTKDTIVVATNAIEPVQHYMQTINPRIQCVYVRYYQRYDKKWDYALLYTRFIDKDLLQNGYFPPTGTIATIKADNTPLCAILKNNTESQLAYQADKYFESKDYTNAVIFYQKALSADPKNETAYDNYAISLANLSRIDEAIGAVNQSLKFTPSSAQSYQLLAQLYQAKGDMANAQQANNTAQAIMTKEQGDASQ
ncbi:MAG: tetratricopeptide repeat protein [Taibaiella sp.]|nr:tetratricopeptide repeat protein [Taibaiella sp.]